jgi:hypothetical protein
LLSAPWFLRNYYIYNEPVIITTRFSDLINPVFGQDPVYKQKLSKLELDRKFKDRWISKKKSSKEKKYIELNGPPYLLEGIEKYLHNLLVHWRFIHIKPYYSKFGYTFDEPWTLRANILYPIQWGLPLIFFLFSIIYMIREKHRMGMYLTSIIIFHAFLHSIFVFGSIRYRLPIDSIVIIIGSYGFIKLVELLTFRKDIIK